MVCSPDQFRAVVKGYAAHSRHTRRRGGNRTQPSPRPDHHALPQRLDRSRTIGGRDHGSGDEAPRCVVLRPSKSLRLLGREQRRDRAVRPDHSSKAGLVDRAADQPPLAIAVTFPARGDQARDAFDHRVAGVVRGGGDQSDPVRAVHHPLADPLRTGAGLARATTAEEEPELPVAIGGCDLIGPRPKPPVVEERFRVVLSECFQSLGPLGLRQAQHRGDVQAGAGLHRHPSNSWSHWG